MYITLVTAYLIMYLAHHKLLNKKQFCEMNEVNEQKLFFVMIYDVLNTLFKWAVTNVIYTTSVSLSLSSLSLSLTLSFSPVSPSFFLPCISLSLSPTPVSLTISLYQSLSSAIVSLSIFLSHPCLSLSLSLSSP